MRAFLVLAGVALLAVPAVAQTRSETPPPGPATQTERQQAGEAFGNAGGNLADAARNTWDGVQHGWQVTKQGVRSGWNKATGDHAPEETPGEAGR